MTQDRRSVESTAERDIPLSEKVAFLSSSDAYSEAIDEVEAIETHMSWVFLAGERAYKMKKPVKYPFLDFSTLSAREADCREEVRLNRRLAPDVYEGIAPLTAGPNGALALDGTGVPVDWLVVMRRLPESKMLDRAIERGKATRERVGAVADLLSDFYRNRAQPAGIMPEDYVAHFARQHEENRSVLTDARFELPDAELKPVLDGIDHIIEREPGLLMRRAREGRIVEGHGDLRPEHVCLIDPPVIIDCIEFNRGFRLVDPIDELAFLSMECERLGAPWIRDVLVDRCMEALGGEPPARLFAFFTAYRGCLRARLSLAHLLEDDERKRDNWVPAARDCLRIAARYAVKLLPPADRPESRPRDSGG